MLCCLSVNVHTHKSTEKRRIWQILHCIVWEDFTLWLFRDISHTYVVSDDKDRKQSNKTFEKRLTKEKQQEMSLNERKWEKWMPNNKKDRQRNKREDEGGFDLQELIKPWGKDDFSHSHFPSTCHAKTLENWHSSSHSWMSWQENERKREEKRQRTSRWISVRKWEARVTNDKEIPAVIVIKQSLENIKKPNQRETTTRSYSLFLILRWELRRYTWVHERMTSFLIHTTRNEGSLNTSYRLWW